MALSQYEDACGSASGQQRLRSLTCWNPGIASHSRSQRPPYPHHTSEIRTEAVTEIPLRFFAFLFFHSPKPSSQRPLVLAYLRVEPVDRRRAVHP
jgi:hypothetical protein